MTVTLTAEEARVLADAVRSERRAQQVAELAMTRARLPWMEAQEDQRQVLAQLVARYGLNPDAPLAFDAATQTLTQDAAAPQPRGA
jgi:hypothetical protein